MKNVRFSRRRSVVFLALGVGWLPVLAAGADTVVYTDLHAGTAGGYGSGGAASQNTFLVADDITFAAGSAGAEIDSFTFTVANNNTTSASATPQLVFYADDGANGGPGTVLYNLGLYQVQLNAGAFNTFTISSTTGLFTIPADNSLWAGIYFLPNSTNNVSSFGQEIYGVPSVGSSTNNVFRSTGPGSTDSDPAGAFTTIAGSNKFNLGWSFSAVITSVPEPSSVALLSLAVPVALSLRFRRRRVLK